MSGSRRTVTRAELARIVVQAARAAPETADVVAVRIGLRPERGIGAGGTTLPHADWFIDGFERAGAAEEGDAAVATGLAEIAATLARSYEVRD